LGLFNTWFKDPLLSKTLEKLLARSIADFGKVCSLSIDTNTKAISLTLELVGEPTPVVINVTKYEFTKIDGQDYICVREFNTSKQWVDIAVKKYVSDLQYRIPEVLASMVKKVG